MNPTTPGRSSLTNLRRSLPLTPHSSSAVVAAPTPRQSTGPIPGELTAQLSEAVLVADELIKEFNKPDELNSLKDIRRCYKEIQDIRSAQQLAMKSTIRSLTDAVDQLKQATANPPAAAYLQQQAVLNAEKEKLTQSIHDYQGTVKREESQLQQQENELKRWRNKAEQVEAETGKKLPSSASTLGLYRGVTSIEWDETMMKTAANGEYRAVKGVFHFEDPHSIQIFHYGVESISQPIGSVSSSGAPVMSRVDIADQLWDTMWNHQQEIEEIEQQIRV